jgi:hypothetical protein
VHVANEAYLANNLDMLGKLHSDSDGGIGAAFAKFAIVTNELSGLMKNLVSGHSVVVHCPNLCELLFVTSYVHFSSFNLEYLTVHLRWIAVIYYSQEMVRLQAV